MGLVVKNLPASAGEKRDKGSIPGSGRYPEAGNGNPLQYSWLANSMDRGAWQATVNGDTESDAAEHAQNTPAHWDIMENWEIFVLFGVHREKRWEVALEGEESGPHDVFGKEIYTELGRNVKKHLSTKPLHAIILSTLRSPGISYTVPF